MASVNVKRQEEPRLFHLAVGTEVSAKYRGAFCEAQIKSIKRNVTYKVTSKKTGKSFHLSEDNIRGDFKIGSTVEAILPDQASWQDCILQSAKDKSSYTVVFDDGDERTLSRGSLCLKGDRHYAKSETLDNLPLTDPENFGTPVLAKKKNRRRRPADDDYDDDSEGQKADRELVKVKEKKQPEAKEAYTSSEDEEDDDEKRARWLADPLMGRVVIVEPHDKRKHWFPGLVVNPLCFESCDKVLDSQLVVRSFKTGKFFRVYRSCVKEMSPATIPTKLEPVWKGIVEDAQNWQSARIIPNRWRMDISSILDSDSNGGEEESSEDDSKRSKKTGSDKSEMAFDVATRTDKDKSNHDFLEELYKFMEDRGSPINKTPVLGYKDLNLYLLYRLVQKRQGSFAISAIKEWKQIYLDLGIPKPNPAAGYNVKTAYQKYLGTYEEYCISWRHIPLPPIKSQGTAMSKERKKTKQTSKEQINKQVSESKKNKDKDAVKGKASEHTTEGKTRAGRNSPVISILPLHRSRRRASESSSASDITNPTAKPEKKKAAKGPKKNDNKRGSIGPDSEHDDASKDEKPAKKDSGEKRQPPKGTLDVIAPKRMRRNSTSSVSVQYFVGDKLKVKYGQGQAFKTYDAKVLRVKTLETLGNQNEYYVHYAGWNARHDEWIPQSYIVGFAEEKTTPSPAASSGKSLSKRPRTPINSRSSSMSKDELTPSPSNSYNLSCKFASVESDVPDVDDDLPDFQVKKPRVSSIFKKNLGDEFKKSCVGGAAVVDVKRAFGPFVVGTKQSKPPFEPPHLLPKPKQTIQNEKLKEKRIPTPRAKEQDKEDSASGEEVKAEVSVKSEMTETLDNICDDDRQRSISPDAGSSSMSETSEDNSNNSDSSTPVRRSSSRHSKSPICYTEGLYAQAVKRKKGGGSSEKSRSPTPENVEEITPSPPEMKNMVQPNATENTATPSDVNQNKEIEEQAGTSSNAKRTGLDAKEEMIAEVSTPDAQTVPPSKEPVKQEQDEEQDDDMDSADVIKSESLPLDASQSFEKNEDTDMSEDNDKSSSPEEGSFESIFPNHEQTEENLQNELVSLTEKRSQTQTKCPSDDSDSTIQNEEADVAHISAVPGSDIQKDVMDPEPSKDANDNTVQCEDNSSIHQPPSLEAEIIEVPVPPQALLPSNNPALQTPLSSSKVLLENTPPTTPEQSPTYTSEDQDIEPEKHSPSIDSDVPDIGDEQKYSAGSASSSGCEQPSTSENQHVDAVDKACAGGWKTGASCKKKIERPNRPNNKRQECYNNDSESEEDHDTTGHRKRRASTSKYKPRKKKAKTRPEPPSAPPPLPREELDGMPQDERIALLQTRMAEMRKIYHQLKQEVANIDRKRKRAKRREREAVEAQSLASKGGLTASTPTKAAAKSDVAACSTVETEPVSKGKDEQ